MTRYILCGLTAFVHAASAYTYKLEREIAYSLWVKCQLQYLFYIFSIDRGQLASVWRRCQIKVDLDIILETQRVWFNVHAADKVNNAAVLTCLFIGNEPTSVVLCWGIFLSSAASAFCSPVSYLTFRDGIFGWSAQLQMTLYLSLSLGNNSGSAFCRRVAPCGVSRNKSRVIRSLCHVVDDKFSSIDWQPAAGNAISLSRKKVKKSYLGW